jgi:hypothetical protein
VFGGYEFGVAVTVAELSPWPDEEAASGTIPPTEPAHAGGTVRPTRLGELLPAADRSDADLAAELQRVVQIEAKLSAYKAELVAAFAALRPDCLDVPRGRSQRPDEELPEFVGTSEFFADELALVLNCSRTAATTLVGQAFTLLTRLPATWAALADGRLDWPRARGLATELGAPTVETDPQIIAEVEEALLPTAGELSIRGLRAAARRELIARDAAAAEQRRARAERAANVTVRPMGDGMAELAAFMPAPLASVLRETIDGYARMAKDDGDPRPLGQLRVGVLSDLITRPWDTDREPVPAHLRVTADLGALAPNAGPTTRRRAEVDGQPITAAQLRRLLERLDAVCPGGLQPPTGGSLDIALVDPGTGVLRATLSRRKLERLARQGCPEHRDTECGCAVLDRPPSIDRYRPTPAQRRFVKTRDRTCRHPGCDNRAAWADLDHVLPHGAGGETDCRNLCCLCRRHHRLKTDAPGWLFAMTSDGLLTVTTPSGVTRLTRPPDLAAAAYDAAVGPAPPEDDPPPF